jgi:hypothetical protein
MSKTVQLGIFRGWVVQAQPDGKITRQMLCICPEMTNDMMDLLASLKIWLHANPRPFGKLARRLWLIGGYLASSPAFAKRA